MNRYQRVYGPAMALFGVIALVLSVILTIHSLSEMSLIGCVPGSSCAEVTGSRWSLLAGFLPVSSLAIGAYLALLVCILYLFFDFNAMVQKVLLALSTAVFLCCLWFIWLQAVKVKAFCPYCMSAHVCGILTAILAFLSTRDLIGKGVGRACGSGALLALAFIVIQLLSSPVYRAQAGRSDSALPIPDATISPVVGLKDAEHAIALLYDYRCSHCRTIHEFLDEAVVYFGGRVAFILCPTPLSSACNPYIPAGGEDRFAGSCELTRLALGLWKVGPEVFRVFDTWLFLAEGKDGWCPRSLVEASEKALELAEGRPMDEAWVSTYLSRTLELFGRTTARGRSGIPRLVFGTSWIIPEADTPEGFIRAIETLLNSE
ncbi:MAG: vitamin K epoxide reductase family protein [Candidatus Cryptobacteroides sp.]